MAEATVKLSGRAAAALGPTQGRAGNGEPTRWTGECADPVFQTRIP